MFQTYTTLIKESEPESLNELIKLLAINMPELSLLPNPNPSLTDLDSSDFFLFEVKETKEIDVLKKFESHFAKTIVVVHNVDCMRELLMQNIFAYIIPPFEATAVHNAFERIKSSLKVNNFGKKMNSVLHLQAAKKSSTIIITTIDGFEVLRYNEIVQIHADRAYCTIHLINDKKITVSKPLKDMESQLPQDLFVRCHKSHLININSIICFKKDDGGHLLLSEGSKVPVAKDKKFELLARLSA